MPLLKLTGNGLAPALEEPLNEISLNEWRARRPMAVDATALCINNDASLAGIEGDIHQFKVIVLEFPTFKDGRAYSQARLLRERYNYAGDIRARGDILRDQLQYMVRCGFNVFEFKGEDTIDAAAALTEFSRAYQSAADKDAPIWRRRLAKAAAA